MSTKYHKQIACAPTFLALKFFRFLSTFLFLYPSNLIKSNSTAMNATAKKRQLVNDENADPNQVEHAEADENEENDRLNGVLPLTRVKRLIKMSAMTQTNVSAGAAKLIQLCAVSIFL
jgi:hypothetical protein